MKDKEIVILLALGVAAWWVWSRSRSTAAPFDPNQMIVRDGASIWPEIPSRAGGATGVGTNPITLAFSSIAGAVSKILGTDQPGNSPSQPAAPANVGVPSLAWTLPPDSLPPPPLSPVLSGRPIPALQDPNQPWWGTIADVMFSVPDRPTDFAANPDVLAWTLDPTILGYDPNAVPEPPAQTGRISITGLEP